MNKKTNSTLYFDWYGKPALIFPVNAGYEGCYLDPDNSKWIISTPHQMLDFFYKGTELTKEEFEEKFGSIGGSLHQLNPQMPT